mgnify:CR=1 FL=1
MIITAFAMDMWKPCILTPTTRILSTITIKPNVVAVLRSSRDILERLDLLAPDIVLTDMQSPDRDTIEDVRYLMSRRPCPIVMYAGARDSQSITKAIDAGVSAYVTDEIDPDDLQSVLDLASARFEQYKSMRDELQTARTALEQRKRLDRAKSILMRQHGLSEEDAHRALQQLAMNQRISISEAAGNVIAMSEALTGAKPVHKSSIK